MDFDFQWLLIGLPIAFALGWMASRLDLRQWRRAGRDAPRAYFKGLNLLLNEQQDKAIDAFIEAVQHDHDTAELHFALGNLFRRRGEFERAVRVHEHLLARADLRSDDRLRARHALAEDYMKAGLLDRAEQAWQALRGSRFERDALHALLALAERSRDWPRAIELARQLEADGAGSFGTRVAHYECEQALQAEAAGLAAEAEAALERARQAAPQAARPQLLAGQRLARGDRPAEAVQAWQRLAESPSGAFLLVASDYAAAAQACGRAAEARALLESLQQRAPAEEWLEAMERLDPGSDAERGARWAAQLQRAPTLPAAARLLTLPPHTWGDAGTDALRRTVDGAAQPLQRYRCAACGFEARHYFWQCPGCLSWDSFPAQRIAAL